MNFYMPTQVFQEKNAVKNNGAKIASFGKKALIVTGKSSSKKNHSLQDVIDVLNENATEYVIFDEVPQNPSVELIMKASEFGRNEGADFVIGIGGGSPMDSAKAIALMIQNRDTTEEVRFRLLKFLQPAEQVQKLHRMRYLQDMTKTQNRVSAIKFIRNLPA